MSGMTGKAIRKQRFKCLAALVCLLMAGNSVHGAVLCFGTDGHVEIEPTFHERCSAPAHSLHTEQQPLSYQVNHEESEHCRPCVDIPISATSVKITRTLKQLNSAFSIPATTVIASAEPSNHSASITFDAARHFVPLRTVILLI